MGADVLALFAAIASSAAIIIQALRKRKDVDLTEVVSRNTNLEERVTALEELVDEMRIELVDRERVVFLLRRVLAQEGIPDPTLEISA